MKKVAIYLITSSLSLPFLAILLVPIPIANAVAPFPVAKSFLMNGNIYDGWVSNVTVSLQVNSNLGYISKDGGNTAANLTLPIINPQAISTLRPLSLNWTINDPWRKDINGCAVNIKSEDAGNNYSNSLDIGLASGNRTFSTANLILGSYSFTLRCNLDNGRILNDFVYVYLVPAPVNPGPNPISLNISSFESDMRKYWLNISLNENSGIVSDGKTSRQSAVSAGTIDPIAFTPSQLSSSKFSMTIYRLPVVMNHTIQSCNVNAPAAGISFGGQINPGIQESPESTPALPSPYVVFQKSWPLTAFSGNQTLFVTCSLSNGNKIKDLIYVYGLPGASALPPPIVPDLSVSVNITAKPISINKGQPTTVSWKSKNAIGFCKGSGRSDWPASGSFIDTPSATKKYDMTCTGQVGSATDSVTVTVVNTPPIGYHDSVDNNTCHTTGWAYDPDDSSKSINVHIYRDGPAGGVGVILDSFPTNVFRDDANKQEKISGNHGFDANLAPYNISDGKSHKLYVYPIDTTPGWNNSLNPLNRTPKTIQCSAPAPIPGKPLPQVDIKVQ